MTTRTTLERAEGGSLHPGTTAVSIPDRHQRGAPNHTPLLPMHIISTAILFHQPGGRLVVSPDDVLQLRAAVEALGGRLEFEEALRRGFIYGRFNGLPVYDITITFPDEVDAATAMQEIDSLIKALIGRHVVPTTPTDPA